MEENNNEHSLDDCESVGELLAKDDVAQVLEKALASMSQIRAIVIITQNADGFIEISSSEEVLTTVGLIEYGKKLIFEEEENEELA